MNDSPAEAIRKELRSLVRELGLLNRNSFHSKFSLAQAHVLNYILKNGSTPVTELQLQLSMDKASLSRIVNGLAEKSYVIIEQSSTDKRANVIRLLPLGQIAIDEANKDANAYITQLFEVSGNCDQMAAISRSLHSFRMLALRNNLLRNPSRMTFETVKGHYLEAALDLAVRIFNEEQDIPSELVPVMESYQPIWWGARIGEDICGTAASWLDNGQWHWGRFAVNTELRGSGLGGKLAHYSLEATFQLGAEQIFLEAREATVRIVGKLGGRVVGDPFDFYGEPVFPMMISRAEFETFRH
ncbi:GNAT family N-acetyltransferase [Brevibacillus sp. NRS-1366]|uniref:GNAT family N-acetyltransferase n=1 Tax=Brevibacillus sp. NRS-1366 TaxID=3233899 RepID=UPI003D25B10F